MSQLHLIQKKIGTDDFLREIRRLTTKGDTLLFLNDSLFSLHTLACDISKLEHSVKGLDLVAIDEQFNSRGLAKLTTNLKLDVIDYPAFVELSCRSSKIVSW